jgi:hypothetical protein
MSVQECDPRLTTDNSKGLIGEQGGFEVAANFDKPHMERQRRLKRQQAIIESEHGDISLFRETVTDFSETGHLTTTESHHSLIVGGENVRHPGDIVGQCQEQGCNRFLTARTMVTCFCCCEVRCPICAAFDDKTGVWLCADCYRSVRWKRFWSALRRLIFFPFYIRRNP